MVISLLEFRNTASRLLARAAELKPDAHSSHAVAESFIDLAAAHGLPADKKTLKTGLLPLFMTFFNRGKQIFESGMEATEKSKAMGGLKRDTLANIESFYKSLNIAS